MDVTIDGRKHRALIDTGSTMSIINSNRVDCSKFKIYERINLRLQTINKTTTEMVDRVVTNIPKEFNYDPKGATRWYKRDLGDKPYDILIGMDLLSKIVKTLDFNNKCLILKNDTKIPLYSVDNETTLDCFELHSTEKEVDLTHLNAEEKKEMETLLHQFKNLIYKDGDLLTNTNTITHEIRTTTDQQINAKLYRLPPQHEEEVRRQITEMEEQGIIRKSNSRYASPIVVVRKKMDNSGKQKFRLCVDYRKLNEITIDDKYPLPNIEGILDKLGRAQYFSSLDLAKGYHQIKVNPNDIPKTAFITPCGLYEYVRMPFGLKNAPATFQRLMNNILRDHINKICVVYLDDILIFSTSLREHINSLKIIFNKLAEHNLKVQFDKCSFMKKNTEFLGHILTAEGMKPNPIKIKCIQDYPLPKTEKQLKGFLGATGYYRKFVKDYAKIANPMIKYLKKDKKINTNDPEYIQAFEILKLNIIKHPILKFPDFTKSFTLFTDASNYAIGAVLTQEGQPVCYASRSLNDHEKNYSVTDKEFLAIVWAVTYFRPYLWGKRFQIITDHLPIKYLNKKFSGKEFSQRTQRWLLKLQEYQFDIEYLKGKENKVADFLSRIPENNQEKEFSDNQSVNNLSDNATTHSQEEQQLDHIQIQETIVNKYKTQIILTNDADKEVEILHNRRIIYIDMTREKDYWADVLRRFIKPGLIGIYTELSYHEFNKIQQLLIELFGHDKQVKFIKATLRAREIKTLEEAHKQISLYHTQESAHSGIIETYHSLKNEIYYPHLIKEITRIINNCKTCLETKYERKPIKLKYELSQTPNRPNETIHMDIYYFRKHPFLTLIDKLTKKAYVYFLPNRNWAKKIETLEEHFSKFGKPSTIITDNEFKSEHLKEFLREQEVELHLTKPNTHTGNSDIERFHSTLQEILVAMRNLDLTLIQKVHRAVKKYNNRYHSTVKMTPEEAMFADLASLVKSIQTQKEKRTQKLNQNRESYQEKRKVIPVKNYKRNYYKNEPRYRLKQMDREHPVNIKRPRMFAGDDISVSHTDNTNDGTGNSNTND